jgi:hypothetical protein
MGWGFPKKTVMRFRVLLLGLGFLVAGCQSQSLVSRRCVSSAVLLEDGVEASCAQPVIKSPPRFDWSKIPPRYRLGKTAHDKIIVFRSDKRDRETIGLKSKALDGQDEASILKIKAVVESGDEEQIHRLIDRHTSSSEGSALLSSSYNPRMAQVFMSTHYRASRGRNSTLYKIEVDADRAIFDADDTGHTGLSGEILILGEIHPEEIVAVKIVNDAQHSELAIGGYILDRPKKSDPNREVKDPVNWRPLR